MPVEPSTANQVASGLSQGATMLSTFAGGFLIKPLFDWLRGRRKERRDDFMTAVDEYKKLLEELKKERSEDKLEREEERKTMTAAHEECHRELETVKFRISGLEATKGEDPFPKWMVTTDDKYLWVNQAFAQRLLTPLGKTLADIIGKTHEEAFGPEVAAKLKSLDQAAVSSPARQARVDHFSFGDPVSGKFTVFKYPAMNGSIHYGYNGIAIDIV